MTAPPSFASLAVALRDQVIEYYERIGKRLDTPQGRRTLDTNSTLAADRGRALLRVIAESGGGPIAGKRLLDLGAGFGSLSVYFAHLGAEVIAVDPHEDRLQIGLAVARRHHLSLDVIRAHAEQLPLPDASFDFAIVNNSFCYIVDRGARRAALSELHRVLTPGGWVAVRDPNRLTPLDPFTGMPLVAHLSPSFASGLLRALDRHRSEVRLTSPLGAVWEMRRAGFTKTRWRRVQGRRLASMFAPHHHVVAKRRHADAGTPPRAKVAAPSR